MKIYYARTVDTNDGINGSALQEFLKRSDLFGKVEILRYEKQPVYSFDKLDSADMMVIGYCKDRYDDNSYIIGKGLYSEIERACEKNIPVFFLNLTNQKIPYLEEISFHADVCVINSDNYSRYGEMGLYYELKHLLDEVPHRLCPYEHFSTARIQDYLSTYGVDLSKLSSQGPTVKYDPVTFQEIETSPSLLLLRRK